MYLLALCLAAPLPQAQHIVDVSGAAGYATLQDAVDAAADGDTILVLRPNDPDVFVPGFELVGKGLAIRGLGGFPVPVGPSSIRAVPESSEVVLESLGFHQSIWTHPSSPTPAMVRAQLDSDEPGLLLETVLAPVRIQRCWIEGAQHDADGPGTPGLQVDLAIDVSLIDTTVLGGAGVTGTAATGLVASRSRVTAYGSSILGGSGLTDTGGTFGDPQSSGGGVALQLTNRSFLWLGDSRVQGGNSGNAHCNQYHCYPQTGDGGDVGTVGASSYLCVLDSSLSPGRSGSATGGFAQYEGDNGAQLVVLGLLTEVPGTQRRLEMPAERRAGEALPVSVEGTPGEPVFVSYGQSSGHRFLGPLFGVFGIRVPYDKGFFHVGDIPTSGVLDTAIPLPPLGSAGPEVVHVQALCGFFPAPDFPPRFRLTEVRTVVVSPDALSSPRPGEVIFVDPSRNGALGRSWDDAFGSLESALGALEGPASSNDPAAYLWLSEGNYVAPESGFRVQPGVTVLGGFTGDELHSSSADPASHPTVISGDRLGDGSSPGSDSDNAEALLHLGYWGSNTSLISEVRGLVFRGSRAENAAPGATPNPVTAAGSTRFIECLFEDCHGSQVSALRHYRGELSVDRCRFLGGRGARYALESTFGSNRRMEIANSLFAGNVITEGNGSCIGVHQFNSSSGSRAWIEGCTFVENSSESYGFYVARILTPHFITNTIVWGNRTNTGAVAVIQGQVSWNLMEDTWTGMPPMFEDGAGVDGVAGTADDNWRLVSGSPGVDAGNNFLVTTGFQSDLGGGTRYRDDPGTPDTGVGGTRVIDMGAYER